MELQITLVISLLASAFFSMSSFGQQPSTYWYNNGLPDTVFYQTDVFSFKCFGGIAYSQAYDSTVVDSIVFHDDRRDMANDVFFNPSTTLL